MTEEHEPVDEVRADKARSAGDEDAFLLGAREFANGRVGGPAREGDGGGPVVDGLRGEAVRGERVGTAVVVVVVGCRRLLLLFGDGGESARVGVRRERVGQVEGLELRRTHARRGQCSYTRSEGGFAHEFYRDLVSFIPDSEHEVAVAVSGGTAYEPDRSGLGRFPGAGERP